MSSLSLLTNDIILVIGGTVKHKFKNFLKIFLRQQSDRFVYIILLFTKDGRYFYA